MNNSTQSQKVDFTKQLPFKIENILKLVFCAISFISLFYSKIILIGLLSGLAACMMGLIRQIGPVKFTKDYLAAFIRNDFGNTLFYIALLFLVQGPNIIFSFPVMLFFAIGLGELALRSDLKFLKSEWVQAKANVVVAYKNDIKVSRCVVELLLFFYSIILLFMSRIGVMYPIMMFNYLRIRGMANQVCNQTFNLVKNKILGKLNGFALPGMSILIKVVNFFFGLLINAPGN